MLFESRSVLPGVFIVDVKRIWERRSYAEVLRRENKKRFYTTRRRGTSGEQHQFIWQRVVVFLKANGSIVLNRLQEDKRLKISTKLYTFEAEYRYGERLILTSYDQELFSTLHDLESSNTYLVLETHKSTDNSRLTEYFCSATQCLTLVIAFSRTRFFLSSKKNKWTKSKARL